MPRHHQASKYSVSPSVLMRQDILLCLRKQVLDSDWHGLTGVSRVLHQLRTWNRVFLAVARPGKHLPLGTTHVIMIRRFDTFVRLNFIWQQTVRKLTLRSPFPAIQLPCRLTYLEILHDYPVQNVPLPAGLLVLHLGPHFDSNVVGWRLPSSLHALTFGPSFNRPVVGWELPRHLKVLKLGTKPSKFHLKPRFQQPLHGWVLPENLKTLELHPFYRFSTENELSSNTFPRNLTTLIMPLLIMPDMRAVILPQGLRRLVLGPQLIHPVGHLSLPKNLKELTFRTDPHRAFTQPVEAWELPDGLVKLRFECFFDFPVQNWKLPETLQHFHIDDGFYQNISGWRVPQSIRYFHVGPNAKGWPAGLSILR